MGRELHIAVVGMAGRFPGAGDIDSLWRLLLGRRDAITRLDDPPVDAARPVDAPGRFVPAVGRLDDIDHFDNEFFAIHPREAAAMDPQQRLFLECAWHALEDAGHAGAQRPLTGMFAACGPPAYLWTQFCGDRAAIDHLAWRTGRAGAALNGNDPQLLPLRTAYALDLKGPAINVQSACSSSLVAIAQACQSLAGHEADLCLAGGVHVRPPAVHGHYHLRGGIHSADGRCRPFDRHATGTVFGDGVAVVVLRRLADALADGDRVDAVIRGWAVNNDGGGKASLSAPSARGQAAAITAAQALADVSPESVSYVEAHGTATPVGDAIELAGLAHAFGDSREAHCGIGSIKSHIGHLDAAAGIAGFIKTVLCLKHRRLAPTLHCDDPLPEFERPGFAFHVVREAADWPADGPRLAGVSSLGVGGTNCHVVLEDWSGGTATRAGASDHLLTLSARQPAALHDLAAHFAGHLGTMDDERFADACYTSNVGRAHFPFRLAVAAGNTAAARARLEAALADPERETSAGGADADDAARHCLEAYERGGMERAAALREVARLYEAGADIDWLRLHRPNPGRRIALPLYPFQRRRHWHDAGAGIDGTVDADPAPMRLDLPFSDEARWSTRWRPGRPAYLSHHRLFGTVVAPASAQLSALLAAGRSLRDDDGIALARVGFLRTLVLPDDGEAEVQLVFERGTEPGGGVRLAAALDGHWHEHTRAQVADPAAGDDPPMTAAIARDVPPQDGEAFYRDRWAQGEDTGESFRWLQSIHAGDGGARGRIARPAGCLGRRSPHPGVIEALFQLVYCCRAIETRESVAATGTVLVPARIERVAWRGEPRGGMTGYAAIREAQADTSSVIADLALVDDDGRTILSVSGFELRPLAREALTRAVRPAVVATRWQPAPPPAATRAGPLCLLGQGPFVDALYARLCEARPVQRHAAASAADIPDGAAVAWLWPLAVSFDPDRDPARPAVDRLLGGLFDLLQASGRRRLPGTRITVVTRHAHALPERNERCDPMQSAAWGFVRVAAREYPNCTFRLVDIDDGEESTMAALARELLGEDDEGEIALRRGARYASRAESVELAASCDGVPPAARYVVTENGGGQGDIVACHLARRGIAVAVCPADGVEAALAGDETTGLVATGSAPCDGLIDGARWDDYASRLSASVDTLLAIHRASTRVADLVLFAAGAARTGNPGQGAYAAAGAFAIGLAARRRAMGLPGRSLAWGPWADAGQWPRLDPRRRARLLADGIAPIGTDDALAALDAFLDGPALDLHVSGVDAGSMAPAKPHAQSDTACAGQHAPTHAGPADDVEHRLRELLADQLGIAPDRLDPDTPLRDLGIDSLDAVSLGEAIETGFGVPAAIGNVVDAGSVRALARLVASRMAPAAPPPVAAGDRTVLVRLTAGRGRPVFCMPADSGTALSLKPLADAMELDRPVYACQAPGTDDGDTTPDSIAGLAQRYVAAMRGVQRTGPYTIIGRCSGGLAAYHAAALLREQGDVVEHLVLIDTLPPAAASSDPALAARQARIDAAIRARIDALPPTARARFARAQAALDHAVNSYRPSLPFDGRLVLVRGEDDRHPVQDDWRALAGGGVEFIDVPGDHQTMFERDALAALAAALAGAVGTGP